MSTPRFKFELTYTDYPDNSPITVEVEEPNGFTDFNSVLERDFETGGVFYRFSESNLLLQFPGEGRSILEGAWQDQGLNAEVFLTVSRAFQDTEFEQVYSGIAVMKNRQLTPEYFEVDFEEESFLNKLLSRKDVPISLDSTEDLDGESTTPALSRNILLPAKKLREVSTGSFKYRGVPVAEGSIWEITKGALVTVIFPTQMYEVNNQIIFQNGKIFNTENVLDVVSGNEFSGQIEAPIREYDYDIKIDVNFTFTTILTGTQEAGTIDFIEG